ncbi:Transcription elongation factor [Heracleum sosnowskyi]|uniref:Transcription elongation factor n=1 Tax=Heracleum sosnowskyi TaxID=360622 RepID=A0AAD8HD77_9APIA|nr:Transcription elongation factor [Heracleum sosnowskyi]
MEKELIQLFQTVEKAAAAAQNDAVEGLSPEEDRCIDVLKQLEKCPVNYDVLVSTQVGKRLRHLTKHPRNKIQALASQIIEIWKNIVVEETLRKNRMGSLDNKVDFNPQPVLTGTSEGIKVENVETLKIEKNDSSAALRSEKFVKYENNSDEDRIEIYDDVRIQGTASGKREAVVTLASKGKQNVDVMKSTQSMSTAPKLSTLIRCNDPVRDKIRELLLQALNKVLGEVEERQRGEVDACDPIRVSVCLESAMFEKWGRSTGAQKVKYRSIMFNIGDSSNPDFRRKVLLGHVQPERVLEMKPEEMASHERQRQNKQIKDKALFECERGKQAEATTTSFKCGRCGKRKCTYYQLQTRSADEPMTTFVTCVNCNKRWKFS